MGTRGIMGFRVGGVDHLSYNHFDSYPSGLGASMFLDLKSMLGDWGLETLKENAQAVRLVTDDEATPTTEEMEKLSEHFDNGVSTGSPDEWYALLRELQGELRRTINSGYMIDSHNFVNDSLFCEWGYIVNLDDEVMEVYRGFQTKPHNKGRYALSEGDTVKEPSYEGGDSYYPIALTVSIPFAELPEDEAGFCVIADPSGALYEYLNENNIIDIATAKSAFNIDLVEWVEKETKDGEEFEWITETTVKYIE